MPHIPKFPENEDIFAEEDHYDNEEVTEVTEETPHYIEPEFTIIDDRSLPEELRSSGSRFDQEDADASNQEKQDKVAFPLRFMCLLGLIFCSIFGIGILLLSIVLSVLSTISLFRKKEINQGAVRMWKICMHTAVAGFGFTIGLLSPTIGLGLVALYFSLNSEIVDEDILRKVIKKSFSKL